MNHALRATMLYVGIDVGINGGLATIDDDLNLIPIPMPPIKDLDSFFKEEKLNIRHVFVEKAHAMPMQGVCSMFNYGEHFGMIQGILVSNEIPFSLIPPREWQKMMFLGIKFKKTKKKNSAKEKALEAANRIFAKDKSFWLKSLRSKKPHDGMIDASLIAECCRRTIK